MELDTSGFGDWANDAFVALNNGGITPSSEKWAAFSSNPSFTIPPSLLTQASIERFGQITPPDELSPAENCHDSAREGSIPIEQLRNEALWPEHQLQALQDYHPQLDSPEQSQPQAQERSPKRRRTTREAAANQTPDHPASSQAQPDAANPQPPKRKRGRPKSQPQMVEAYTADGYPFHVSSARQSHLEKNRVAAHKCRQRKKEYINGLEARARDFSTKNKALKENVAMLREEVLELKNEVLRHAGCGFWAVDEYLARCAGDLLGVQAPDGMPGSGSRKLSHTRSPTSALLEPAKQRECSAESLPSQGTTNSPDTDDYGGLELLQDTDEEEEGQRI
ncbi:hypothetical protein BU26DRAFT_518106 [Trematosphaeria pertusa]|uniref:BZIP domain-containing protein n=1 Tax=Trematosphaeria pertusa TaxID=390896 RepID=A0A6A6ILY3_9PLEO|nr:uncharacterized protein BU26DRAFT_518106 [Trematosphaeria pertusa]KAF2251451.1 hypothetical protein BU26DRAFT_518106 [Trematosphaeria pertusa]